MNTLRGLLLGPPLLVYGAFIALVHKPIRGQIFGLLLRTIATYVAFLSTLMGWGAFLVWWLAPSGGWWAAAGAAVMVVMAVLVFFFGSAMFLFVAGTLLGDALERIFVASVSRVIGEPVTLSEVDNNFFAGLLKGFFTRLLIAFALLALALIPAFGPLIALVAGFAISAWFVARDASDWHARRHRTEATKTHALPFLTLGLATALCGAVPFLAFFTPIALATGAGLLSANLSGGPSPSSNG